MESRYRWTDSDVATLRDDVKASADALAQASALVADLEAEMAADGLWSGEHKIAFVAWMDLLAQYHARLADPAVGAAAVGALDGFLAALAGYDQSSAVRASLGGVS